MKSGMSYIQLFVVLIVALTVALGCTPSRNITKTSNDKQYAIDNKGIDEFGEESNDFSDDTVRSANKDTLDNDKIAEDFSDSSAIRQPKYYQSGIASWYGREFHGKVTASGEKFNMYKMSAAHKSLPFGTIVRVHNLQNGKSVVVKITDRGPYRGNRIIDLSYSAAKRIDLVALGEGKVGIEILKKGQVSGIDDNDVEGKIAPVADDLYDDSNYDSGNYLLQIGAFYSKKNATKLQMKVQDIVEKPVKIVNENDLYKVRLEGISTKSEANRIKRILNQEDIKTYIIEK